MTKLTEDYIIEKNFYHRGFSAPGRGYLHVRDHYFPTTFLETAWPIKAKLYVDPSWKEGMNILLKWSYLHDQDGCHAHI